MGLKTFFTNNPMALAIVGGGTSTAIITWGLNKVKWIPVSLWNVSSAYFISNLQINESEYHGGANRIDKVRELERFIRSFNNVVIRNSMKLDTEIRYTKLTPGMYYLFKPIKEHGVFMIIQTFLVENKAGSGKSNIQRYNIKVVGFRKLREKFLEMIIKELDKTRADLVIDAIDSNIFYISIKDDTEELGCMSRRDLSTVYIEDDLKNKLVSHLDNWKRSERMYKELSIMYKTGVILYGEPGTGKTSLVKALVSHLNAILIIASPTKSTAEIKKAISALRSDEYSNRTPYTRDNISGHMSLTNTPIVVLFEEFDKYFLSNSVKNDKGNKDKPKEADSGDDDFMTAIDNSNVQNMLQFLDGIDSPENVVFIATTNYIEHIEPALIRPGRFDLAVSMDKMNTRIAQRMVNDMLPGRSIEEFSSHITENGTVNSSELFSELMSQRTMGGK